MLFSNDKDKPYAPLSFSNWRHRVSQDVIFEDVFGDSICFKEIDKVEKINYVTKELIWSSNEWAATSARFDGFLPSSHSYSGCDGKLPALWDKFEYFIVKESYDMIYFQKFGTHRDSWAGSYRITGYDCLGIGYNADETDKFKENQTIACWDGNNPVFVNFDNPNQLIPEQWCKVTFKTNADKCWKYGNVYQIKCIGSPTNKSDDLYAKGFLTPNKKNLITWLVAKDENKHDNSNILGWAVAENVEFDKNSKIQYLEQLNTEPFKYEVMNLNQSTNFQIGLWNYNVENKIIPMYHDYEYIYNQIEAQIKNNTKLNGKLESNCAYWNDEYGSSKKDNVLPYCLQFSEKGKGFNFNPITATQLGKKWEKKSMSFVSTSRSVTNNNIGPITAYWYDGWTC